ncbi:MAG: Denitrification system component NirT [Acidiferrobacteraceae bacterium]|nr:Denitrification system component NirT [Acidiferrobacteraceae bacterium]
MLRRLMRRWPLWSVASALLLGIVLWGGFNWALAITNTEEFCISCHEMRSNVYLEYQSSVHYSNRSGVGASCPDCHVPRGWWPMTLRKITATNELFFAVTGSINTREKFLAKRWLLAQKVWDTLAETDSRECRNCHIDRSMNLANQSEVARDRHTVAAKEGKTCIDCHKGIAHELPEDFLDAEHERIEEQGVPCGNCHQDMWQPPVEDGTRD